MEAVAPRLNQDRSGPPCADLQSPRGQSIRRCESQLPQSASKIRRAGLAATPSPPPWRRAGRNRPCPPAEHTCDGRVGEILRRRVPELALDKERHGSSTDFTVPRIRLGGHAHMHAPKQKLGLRQHHRSPRTRCPTARACRGASAEVEPQAGRHLPILEQPSSPLPTTIGAWTETRGPHTNRLHQAHIAAARAP